MATRSCSLRGAACYDAARNPTGSRCLSPHPDGLSPSRASSSSCQRSAAAWWSTEHGGEGAAVGSALGPLKRLCLTSEWSVSMAGGGGDGSGCPWGLLWLPLVLSPEARSGRCSPPPNSGSLSAMSQLTGRSFPLSPPAELGRGCPLPPAAPGLPLSLGGGGWGHTTEPTLL